VGLIVAEDEVDAEPADERERRGEDAPDRAKARGYAIGHCTGADGAPITERTSWDADELPRDADQLGRSAIGDKQGGEAGPLDPALEVTRFGAGERAVAEDADQPSSSRGQGLDDPGAVTREVLGAETDLGRIETMPAKSLGYLDRVSYAAEGLRARAEETDLP
jgi:hypothetical protein